MRHKSGIIENKLKLSCAKLRSVLTNYILALALTTNYFQLKKKLCFSYGGWITWIQETD